MQPINVKYSIFRLLVESEGKLDMGFLPEKLLKQVLESRPEAPVQKRDYRISRFDQLGTTTNYDVCSIELSRAGTPPNLRPYDSQPANYSAVTMGSHIRCLYIPQEAMLLVPHGVNDFEKVKQPASVIAKLIQTSPDFASNAPFSAVSAKQMSSTVEALAILSNTQNEIRSITLTLPSPNPAPKHTSIPYMMRDVQNQTGAGQTSMTFSSKESFPLVQPVDKSSELREIWIAATKEVQRLGGETKGKYLAPGERKLSRFGRTNVTIEMFVSPTIAYDDKDEPASSEAIDALLPQLKTKLAEQFDLDSDKPTDT